jgi:hypothetical protein
MSDDPKIPVFFNEDELGSLQFICESFRMADVCCETHLTHAVEFEEVFKTLRESLEHQAEEWVRNHGEV